MAPVCSYYTKFDLKGEKNVPPRYLYGRSKGEARYALRPNGLAHLCSLLHAPGLCSPAPAQPCCCFLSRSALFFGQTPTCVSSQDDRPYAFMEPWAYEGPFERSMSRLRSYLEINGAKVSFTCCTWPFPDCGGVPVCRGARAVIIVVVHRMD